MSKHSSSRYQITYEETTFFGLLKISGFKSLFADWSTIYALVLTVLFNLLICSKDFNLYNSLAKDFSATLLGASATVFGIVLAALAVTVSVFHQSLLPALLETKLLHKYLFPFWYAVGLWGMNLTIYFFLMLLTSIDFNYLHIIEFLFIFNTFIFIYATFCTVKLTGLVVQLTLQRAQIKD
ncbi:hypothetical protein [Heyndrickxia acidicola]|uniref:Uncharacterized protein n=1 Tax=Heyndrickxia acidicola TaxID=209389 RepID=A0ABU6MBC7_9BACI|nr:hypothetical protein [Heyndrickxia acidicola]MED1201987.1 hypothetical protein [Heyndrickxia acidicola]